MSTKKVSEVAKSLVNEGALSEETANILNTGEREIKSVDLPELSEDPVFACFIFDASGSMAHVKDSVLNSHPIMLDALRASRKCKNDALYVAQYLFSDHSDLMNPFEKLNANKNDSVVILNNQNYQPNGTTALYKTVFYLLQDMASAIEDSFNQGIESSFSIAVITDGEDNIGGVSPSDIRTVVTELRNKKYLRSSLVLGLVDNNFTDVRLDEIRSELGFEQAMSVTRDPKEIRRAFVLASQSALSHI